MKKKLPKCSICKQTKIPFQVIGNNKVICEDCLKECEHVQVDYVDMYIPKIKTAIEFYDINDILKVIKVM